jgi:hypothetical protein
MTTIIKNTYTGLQGKTQLFYSDSNKTRISSTDLIKTLKHKISRKIHPVGVTLFSADSDMGKLLTVAFRHSFTNAPEIETQDQYGS